MNVIISQVFWWISNRAVQRHNRVCIWECIRNINMDLDYKYKKKMSKN